MGQLIFDLAKIKIEKKKRSFYIDVVNYIYINVYEIAV